MNTTVDSEDTGSRGMVGLVAIGGILLVLLAWFLPSIGVLLGLAMLAAAAVSLVILGLAFAIAAIEAVYSGSRNEAKVQTVQIKRRMVGI